MLSEKVGNLLNDQINKEMYSAYLYLDFANFYERKGLDGYANWYDIQAKEEMDHAIGILRYLQDNDYVVTLSAIAKPDKELVNLDDPLKFGLEHEKYVTSLIHNIYSAAYEDKDFRTMKFLDWYVEEQGEEEVNANDLLTKFELFGHDPQSLYSLDNELATRTYTQASILGTTDA
ncbi:MAG: ferritin [Erysipelotrichaceae bacterium]|nr:ferritin [Erysipelotrichaceae bacterium]